MSQPYNVIYASSIPGVVLDCVVNPLLSNVGKTPSGGTPTDNTTALNNALLSYVAATGGGNYKLILDGGSLTTGLIIPSLGNYEIEGIGWTSGIFMKAGSNSNAIYNDGTGPSGFDKQTTPPTRGGWLRLSKFTINGNRGNGTNGNSTTGDPRGIAASYWYMNIAIANVQGVRIEDMFVYDAPGYGIRLTNCGDIVIKDCNVDNPCVTFTHNQDCIHLSGPWEDARIEGNTLYNNLSDDAIALNAPEGYGGNASRSVVIGNTINNCYNGVRIYGGFYPSGPTNWQVFTVVVDGNTGTTSNSAFILGGLNTENQDASGQAITLANNTFNVTGGPFISFLSGSVGDLLVSNCIWNAPSSSNAFILGSGSISNLIVDNCGIYRNTSGNTATTPLLGASAAFTIKRMTIDNFQIVDENGQSYSAVANLITMGNLTLGSLYIPALDWTKITALADSYTNITSIYGPGFQPETNIQSKTGAYTLLPTDRTILASTTSGSFAVTLPAKSYAGQKHTIKNTGTTNTLTVTGTVDGSANPTLTTLASMTIVFDGTAWWKI